MIADNDIDLSNEFPEKTVAQGVYVQWATGADIQILLNRVINRTRNSLESLDNYPGEDGSGLPLIKGNTIITAEKGSATWIYGKKIILRLHSNLPFGNPPERSK